MNECTEQFKIWRQTERNNWFKK